MVRILFWTLVVGVACVMVLTGQSCGSDFVFHLDRAGRCGATDTPREVLYSMAVIVGGVCAVVIALLVLRRGRSS